MKHSKHKQSGNAQDPSGDATDSEEPPGPASRQAQHLHWSPGPPTSGARTRQTPVNNVCDTANARQEPGSNTQDHPRQPPEGPWGVSQPPRTASTHVQNGQTKVAEMRPRTTWPTCENEPADALATANREALLPRTGIYETTPMTIGEAPR